MNIRRFPLILFKVVIMFNILKKYLLIKKVYIRFRVIFN